MKILQVTNIVSHHQLPIAIELCKLVGDDNFRFAAIKKADAERAAIGWRSDDEYKWLLRPAERESDLVEFERFWEEADVVLCGERLLDKMLARVSDKKICFYMSERWWKPPIGLFRLIHPLFFKMAIKFFLLSRNHYFHCLPIGPFAAKDFRFFPSLRGRMWSWGYFTELPGLTREFTDSRPIEDPLKVLWVGRMLALKTVDILIKAVANVQASGCRINLTLIGDGPERQRLERLAGALLDAGSYKIENFVPHVEVPRIMLEHDVYVLPSNAYEGWGAVINEAMSAGCVVIASDETGAGKAMIVDKKNGILFRSGSVSDLTRALRYVAYDSQFRKGVSQQAMSDMSSLWSPAVAARRFFEVSDRLLLDKDVQSFSDGPMKKL